SAADFVNLSTKSNQYDTLAGKFLFDATLAVTQNFCTAGIDLETGLGLGSTGALSQITLAEWDLHAPTNFGLGTLEISNLSTARVWDSFLGDGNVAALYLSNLVLDV